MRAFLFPLILLAAPACVDKTSIEDPACERGYNDGCNAAMRRDPLPYFEDSTYEDCYRQGYEDCMVLDSDALNDLLEPVDSEEGRDAESIAPLAR